LLLEDKSLRASSPSAERGNIIVGVLVFFVCVPISTPDFDRNLVSEIKLLLAPYSIENEDDIMKVIK